MTQLEYNFIQLIRLAMGIPCEELKDIDWDGTWKLACRNHMETIIQSTMKYFDDMPEDIVAISSREANKMLARTMLQEQCLAKVEKALTEAGIHYGLQKGAILRNDYPKKYLRFMSDLDFYIKPEERKKIRKVMNEIGIAYFDTESGDDQFSVAGGGGIEFHGRLLYRRQKNGIENYSCWEYVDEKKNRLTEEGFALNLIGHVVYDLSKGGPGLRYVLDLWVYQNRRKMQPDWSKVEERLKKDGIYEAAMNLINLSECLFGKAEKTPLLEDMADYVLQGGAYVGGKRNVVSEIALAGNSWRWFWRHLLRNRNEYENRYPWLKGKPFLFPIAWFHRIVHSMKNHKKEIKKWNKNQHAPTKKEIREQREFLSKLGI